MLVDAWRGTPRGFQWINKTFYDGNLSWEEVPKDHIQRKQDAVTAAGIMRDPAIPVAFIEIDGKEEPGGNDNNSKLNRQEAQVCRAIAQGILSKPDAYTAADISVICMYSGQVNEIRSIFAASPTLRHIRVGTVDAFQGSENNVVIVCTTRTKERPEGFIRDKGRICVAASRHKHALIVLGHKNMCTAGPDWPSLIEDLQQGGLSWDPTTSMEINCITSPCGWCWEDKAARYIMPLGNTSVTIRYTPEKEYGLWATHDISRGTVIGQMGPAEYRQWILVNRDRPFSCWSYPRPESWKPCAGSKDVCLEILRDRMHIRRSLQVWHARTHAAIAELAKSPTSSYTAGSTAQNKYEIYKLRQQSLLLGVLPTLRHSPLVLVNEPSTEQRANVEFRRTTEDTMELVTTCEVTSGTELVTWYSAPNKDHLLGNNHSVEITAAKANSGTLRHPPPTHCPYKQSDPSGAEPNTPPEPAVYREPAALCRVPQAPSVGLSNQELRVNAAIGKIQHREKLKALQKRIRDHVNKYEEPDIYHSVVTHLQHLDSEITATYQELDAADQRQWRAERAQYITVVEAIAMSAAKEKWEHLLRRQMHLDSWRIGDKVNEHLHETELQLQLGIPSFPEPIKVRVLGAMLHLLDIQHGLRTDMVQHSASRAACTVKDTERTDSKGMKLYKPHEHDGCTPKHPPMPLAESNPRTSQFYVAALTDLEESHVAALTDLEEPSPSLLAGEPLTTPQSQEDTEPSPNTMAPPLSDRAAALSHIFLQQDLIRAYQCWHIGSDTTAQIKKIAPAIQVLGYVKEEGLAAYEDGADSEAWRTCRRIQHLLLRSAKFIMQRRYPICNHYVAGGYRRRKVYNIDADNKMHENLRKQADRIINTWSVIKSSKRCFEEYSDIGVQKAAAHIDRMREAREEAQVYMEEIREEWLWRYVSRSRQRWATGAATNAQWRSKERTLVEDWELLAYNLGKYHDERAKDKNTTLEDKMTGGNETVSWYDRGIAWMSKGTRGELTKYPYRDEMRSQWNKEHPHISYPLMLARLSMCMGEIDRMEKCRDVCNTPLAVQGINSRMRELLDDNLEGITHKHGVRAHSPSDNSPVIYFHPARELALRNASDQWGRPAGKSTHTGRAIAMPAKGNGVSLEHSLDEEELTEVNINTIAAINSEVEAEHRDRILAMVTTSAHRKLKQAEHNLEILNYSEAPHDQAQYVGWESLVRLDEPTLAAALTTVHGKHSDPLLDTQACALLVPQKHPIHADAVQRIKAQGKVYEGFAEESNYACEAPERTNLGYDVTQSIGKEEANGSVLVSAPMQNIYQVNGQRGICVDFPDTIGSGPGRRCRGGYYTQAMQIHATLDGHRHPYVEQWCEPTSPTYGGRQDFWTAARSRDDSGHRWMGSLWKQLEQITEVGDEVEKGITGMALGSAPNPEMRCSSHLPSIAAGKEVVQREYRTDSPYSPSCTTYRLRVIRLSKPWQAGELQKEWQQVCDRLHMQEARVHALLMQGLRIMGCIEALADAAELLIYARQVANPVAHTCKVKEELSKLEQWAIRLDKVAWPQDPQYAVPSTIADRIEKWMQQYMHSDADLQTWMQVFEGPPPAVYTNILRTLNKLGIKANCLEAQQQPNTEDADAICEAPTADDTQRFKYVDSQSSMEQPFTSHPECMDTYISFIESVKRGGTTTTTTTTEGIAAAADMIAVCQDSPTASCQESPITNPLEIVANTDDMASQHDLCFRKKSFPGCISVQTLATIKEESCTGSKPWWHKGYDGVDASGTTVQCTFQRLVSNAEGGQELIKMANKKDINSLLHDFIQLELGRGLGIIKNHSTIHAQQLGNVASARALSSKSTEEKQQWLEEIEASAPDLSRVLRRYIGLFGLGRSTKGREALEYYSLTGDPNPRTRTHIKQQLSMARRGSSVTQTSRGGGVSEQGLSRQ